MIDTGFFLGTLLAAVLATLLVVGTVLKNFESVTTGQWNDCRSLCQDELVLVYSDGDCHCSIEGRPIEIKK